MAGNPVKKLTKSRQGSRMAHKHLRPPNLTLCPQCRSPKLPHHACPNCGYYKGRYIPVAEQEEEE